MRVQTEYNLECGGSGGESQESYKRERGVFSVLVEGGNVRVSIPCIRSIALCNQDFL